MELRTFGLVSLLLLAAVSGVVMADHGGLHVTQTEYGGDARVQPNEETNTMYLWTTERFNATATVETGNASGNYRACLFAHPTDNSSVEPKELACQPATFEPGETRNFTFTDLSSPTNATTKYELRFVVDNALQSGDPVAEQTTNVTFLEPDKDLDGDNLNNRDEVANGTGIDNADTDNDTLEDGEEIEKHGTDPLDADTDGDGLRDGLEVQLGMDPTWSAVPLYILGVLLLGGLVAVGYRLLAPRVGRVTSNAGGATVDDPTSNGGTGGTTTVSTTDDSSVDTEFVSDEDRILQILAENGGRLMQSRLVELTDWSKSKVSRRLSTLEEEGRIRKITLGRENMVALPGHEPDGAQSPFEEEQ
ncbi:helix-turn-helix transcriptional regulator [Halogranum amylolyticum]|nr:helix-turn-helix domain-containing protein [Halogranum amylolyticum]